MRKEKSENVSTNGNSLEGDPAVANKSTRTTVFLTTTLNDNLDALALKTGSPKGEHVRKAITEYLQKQGMNPHKKPKVTVTY